MSWNWQQPDWPKFTWDVTRLARAEEAFLLGAGVVLGTIGHLAEEDRDALIVETLSSEALTTSEIEGETLDRESVQSSIRRQLGLSSDHRPASPSEQGIAEMMVDLYRTSAGPLDDERLLNWHRMIVQARGDLRDIGRYRTHQEPMQIVSGTLQSPKVHFEAPPSARVPAEMARFIDWFNQTASSGSRPLPALTRSGIAHLYFVSIHPFEDGNGRLGRAIAEKALAQSTGQPTLTSLAATILVRRKAYYHTLERANRNNEITDWLAWSAGVTLEAQRRTRAQVEFIVDKTHLLDRLRNRLNTRQEKALLRMLREGLEGFEGGLSAGKYARITGTSPATATRDLVDLVAKGALQRSGERRYTRYHLALPHRSVPQVLIAETGDLDTHEDA